MPKIVLVHGYNRNYSDMKQMQENLNALGYEALLVDLPLTFHPIDYGASILRETLGEIIRGLPENEKFHLVGHSTGGLVIRSILTEYHIKCRVGRCVLIATPNYGCELADLAGKFSEIFTDLFGTLKSLQSEKIRELEPLNSFDIDIGAVAGNRNNLVLGMLLEGENDGRVTVKSVNVEGLKDFIVLPFGHKEIHKQVKTAKYVDNFLSTGKFRT